MKDQAVGIAICPSAADWAAGRRSPHDPLPGVDGQPPNDFSKSIERFTARGTKIAQADDALVRNQASVIVQNVLPNSCATCWFYDRVGYGDWHRHRCNAFAVECGFARNDLGYCGSGAAWRPDPTLLRKYSYENHRGFWSRLGEALISRLAGR